MFASNQRNRLRRRMKALPARVRRDFRIRIVHPARAMFAAAQVVYCGSAPLRWGLFAVFCAGLVLALTRMGHKEEVPVIAMTEKTQVDDRFWDTFKKAPPVLPPVLPEKKAAIDEMLGFADGEGERARLQKARADREKTVAEEREDFLAESNTSILDRFKKRFVGDRSFYEDQSTDTVEKLRGMVPNATDPTYPIDMQRVIIRGHIINVVLMQDLRSELPSKTVKAMVDEDIYGFHGRKILIPKGSIFLGSYEPLEGPGATRLGVTWDRFITPDGINGVFNTETAGPSGISGMTGDVDRRWADRFAFPLLTTAALVGLSSVTNNNGENNSTSQAFNSGANELSAVNAQVIEESLDIAPVVTISKGSRMVLSPLADMFFKEARGSVQQIEPILNQTKENET